jgi:hypothetical protein
MHFRTPAFECPTGGCVFAVALLPTATLQSPAIEGCSLLRPLLHPLIYRLVQQSAVLSLLDKVAVVWEVKHFGGNPQALQGSKELKSLGNIKKIIALSVNYHRSWRIIGLSSDKLVSNSPGLYSLHDETFW